MGLREISYEDVGWIQQLQDRNQWWSLVNNALNLHVP
jgi:hypothetical protein